MCLCSALVLMRIGVVYCVLCTYGFGVLICGVFVRLRVQIELPRGLFCRRLFRVFRLVVFVGVSVLL